MPPKKTPVVNNPPAVTKKTKRASSKRKAKEIEATDDEPTPEVVERPAEKVYWEKDLSRTDRLLEWLENNPSDRQRLFSDSAQDAKEEGRARRVARGAKSEFHLKIATYVFSVDTDARVRKEMETNVNKYAKAVENRLGSLKTKYREFNKTLGQTGSGLTVTDIRESPHLSNLVDGLLAKLPCWERLHGFWRTLPSYNPFSVSSEPGQNLVEEALELMQPKSADNRGEDSGHVGDSELQMLDDDFEEPEPEVDGEAPESIPDLAKDDVASRSPSPVPFPSEESAISEPVVVKDVTKTHSKQISHTRIKSVPRLRETSTTSVSSITSTPKYHSTGKLASTHKTSAGMKRTRINSLVDGDTGKLVEMATARQEYKMRALDVKRQKYTVEADKERYAAEDRAVAAKERMMEKEHRRQQEREEHERKMMQYQIQLLQLQQPSITTGHSLTSPSHTLFMDTGSTSRNPATGLNNFKFNDDGMSFSRAPGQSPYLPNKIFDSHQRF